ncbi:MAG TPA: YceI family protein [Steroidobacteraceae bacterium]|nr:YceI family protein [Steroidobacteraceae bacterium]
MALALIARPFVAVIACVASVSAASDAWRGDQNAGSLQFVATQAGAKFTGGFRTFTVRFDFDPARPAGGSLDVTVDLKSVDTADADRDGILESAEFFWTDRHPQARFHANRFRREAERWRADGELTLRGSTQPVAVLFALDGKPRQLGMKGTATLRRLDFGVGQGEWSTTEWIGDEVEVRFDLKLNPSAALP